MLEFPALLCELLKVPADALEALLGALLLIGAPSPHTFHGLVESFTGGLQTCFVLMSRLPWFGTEDILSQCHST